jgi:ketosteroid isomerase-like protein
LLPKPEFIHIDQNKLIQKFRMKRILFSFLVIAGCTSPAKDLSEQSAKEIREADLAMNDMAVKEGFNKALLAYADDQLIKPQDGQLPIIGKKALEDHYAGKDGTSAISWSPVTSSAASSGDLGYTIGNWKYVTPDTTMYGLYYTIWKKQPDGKWKWAVDGGNNMPGEFKMQ